jgi:hypothetical protein
MIKTIKRRLAAVIQQLVQPKKAIREVIVRGGLVHGVAHQARIVGGQTIQAEPDESFEDFRQRMRVVAESEGAKSIIFGGLTDAPVEWAQPPGQEEALAKAGKRGTDEIDSDYDGS